MKRNSKGQFVKVAVKDRFWDKVTKTEDCWNWNGRLNSYGYGVISLNGKFVKAHRVSYELTHNYKLCPAECILHSCDNPKCVNPHHLRIGTQRDNINDMIVRKRNKFFEKGSAHPNSKLSDTDIRNIKAMLEQKIPQHAIAKQYDICQQTISKINLNERYV